MEEYADVDALARTVDRRLNVGSGEFPLSYYRNLDSNPAMPADYHADATEFLSNCDAGDLDEIYAGHFLEHLSYTEGQAFLREAFRVLTPGGKIGVVVPDAREVLRRWLAGTIDAIEYPERVWWPIADLNAVCHLILYSDAQESPHKWAYDRETLARALKQAGFVELAEIDRYRDPRIPVGAWYQCGIQGEKPKEGE